LRKYDRPVADVILTDPPYSDTVHDTMGKRGPVSGGKFRKVAVGFDALTDYSFVPEWVRLARRWSLFFCAMEQLGDYKRAAPSRFVRSGTYVKAKSIPQLTGDRPGHRCEGIAIFHAPGKTRWNGGGTSACWVAMPPDRKVTKHPTAKPLNLAMRLVELFTNRGEMVLDPFMGSGTFGMACRALGRRYVGIEMKAADVENAKERINGMDVAKSRREYRAWLLRTSQMTIYDALFPEESEESEGAVEGDDLSGR
jgi:site-specific DNA-methyltransferase (adenine-specific)